MSIVIAIGKAIISFILKMVTLRILQVEQCLRVIKLVGLTGELRNSVALILESYFIYLFLILFTHSPSLFIPHMPSSTSTHTSTLHHNYHTVVCVCELFFFLPFFAWSLNSPNPLQNSLPCICESVCSLLVSSVCSLDFTYEWNYMVFVFLWQAYFI